MAKPQQQFPSLADLTVEWGRNIAEHRRAVRWTSRTFARLVDVDYALVSRWENGHAVPTDENKIRIAGAFGAFVDEIFPWPQVRPPMPAPKEVRPAPADGRRKVTKPAKPNGPVARRAA